MEGGRQDGRKQEKGREISQVPLESQPFGQLHLLLVGAFHISKTVVWINKTALRGQRRTAILNLSPQPCAVYQPFLLPVNHAGDHPQRWQYFQ